MTTESSIVFRILNDCEIERNLTLKSRFCGQNNSNCFRYVTENLENGNRHNNIVIINNKTEISVVCDCEHSVRCHNPNKPCKHAKQAGLAYRAGKEFGYLD